VPVISTRWLIVGVAVGFMLIVFEPAFATSSAGMPWEDPLDKIQRSLTGPVAMVVSLLGVLVAGVGLIFGGEMGDFTRRVIMLVFVISMIVSASTFLNAIFGSTTAIV